jgi:hypothetical protein
MYLSEFSGAKYNSAPPNIEILNQFVRRSYDKSTQAVFHFHTHPTMASADNNTMPPPATVAPHVQAATQRGREGYATQHSGQNWSRAAVVVNMTTPISNIINVENHASATSSLTTSHTASIASAAAMPSGAVATGTAKATATMTATAMTTAKQQQW